MKLADIKRAVTDAAYSELKRALYNSAAVMEMSDIQRIYNAFIEEVYASDETKEVGIDS